MTSRVLAVLFVTVVIMMMMMNPTEAKRNRKRGPSGNWRRQTNETCQAKYQELSPTHTRCLTDNENATLRPLSPSQKRFILKKHNDFRIKVDPTASNMMKMVWDDNLAITAQKWVMQCLHHHDNMRDRMEPDWPLIKIGQNLGLGHRNFNVMMDRFYTEKDRFNYTYGEGYVKGAGHFFQLVSHETTRVGCAMAYCPHTKHKIFRACNYAPALNAAEPPYKNGTSCGDCPNNCDASGKLCDCKGKLCYNNGVLDPNTCQCKCQKGRTGENCEKLVDCSSPDPVPACRHGFLKSEDCGKPGKIIHDPTMCPHLCGFCDKQCGGRVCQNGGILDYKTCKCDCGEMLMGDTCELCPHMDKGHCTKFLPRTNCSVTKFDCPIYCGVCQTQCARCENLGDLDTRDCSCKCKGQYTGPRCEICPPKDRSFCDHIPMEMCTKIPNAWATMHAYCPYRCGICPKSP